MTQWLWSRIEPIARWWTFIGLFVLIVLFQQLAFKRFLAHYQRIQTFDGRMWGFAPSDVEGILAQFKGIGRLGTYALQESTADLVFPLVYGLTFCVAIAGLGRRLADGPALLVLPIATVISDYTENFNAIAMALIYRGTGHVPAALTWIAAVASRMKWGMTSASIIVVVLLLVTWPLRR